MRARASKARSMRFGAAASAGIAPCAAALPARAVPYCTAIPLDTLGGIESAGLAIGNDRQVTESAYCQSGLGASARPRNATRSVPRRPLPPRVA
jgi:hypothetical protein